MSDRSTTRERVLEISRQLFNEKGYAATSLSEIAEGVGIAKGNLTYHFPSKRDLAVELEKRAQQRARDARANHPPGTLADVYVQGLQIAMNNSWEHRFLFRDQAQFRDGTKGRRPDSDMNADLQMLHEYLQRMNKEGMFRQGLKLDLGVLARSLFIVSRYWMDHLRETEGLEEVSWADQERGLQHHFAVLFPCLTAAARREFESALVRLASSQAIEGNERWSER